MDSPDRRCYEIVTTSGFVGLAHWFNHDGPCDTEGVVHTIEAGSLRAHVQPSSSNQSTTISASSLDPMLADYDTGGPIETGLLQRREDSLFALSSVVEFRLRPSGARSGMTTITARGEIGGELLELSREIEVKVELTGLGRP